MAGIKGRSGRKEGQTIKRTRAIAEAAMEGGLTPLEYMLAVLRNEEAPVERRDDMAKAAAPYIHPKLAAITFSGDKDKPVAVSHTFDNITDATEAYLKLVKGH